MSVTVFVMFGDDPTVADRFEALDEPDDADPNALIETFEFATQAEADAFRRGLIASLGWSEFYDSENVESLRRDRHRILVERGLAEEGDDGYDGSVYEEETPAP